MKSTPHTFDYEFKYRFEDKDIHSIRHWINQFHNPDPLHPKYIVATHYYDVEDIHTALSFPSSELPTDKYRLRQYKLTENDRFTECFIEYKSRSPSGKRFKIKKMLSSSHSLIDPTQVHGSEIYHSSSIKGFLNLKYSLTMTYLRERFVPQDNSYSICLDTDISVVSSRFHQNFSHVNKCMVNVLEVKTSDPGMIANLNFPNHLINARYFSKYKYACETSFIKDNK